MAAFTAWQSRGLETVSDPDITGIACPCKVSRQGGCKAIKGIGLHVKSKATRRQVCKRGCRKCRSCAQMIIALSELGISIQDRFVKVGIRF